MDPILSELDKIDEAGFVALQWVEKREWRKARRALRPLRSSFCVVESDRVIVYIEALILQRQGKLSEAAEAIRSNLHAVWCCREAFSIMNCINPRVSEHSRAFLLSVQGTPRFMPGGDSLPIADYGVFASSYEEALRYIRELDIYPAHGFSVLEWSELETADSSIVFEGVFGSTAFRREESREHSM